VVRRREATPPFGGGGGALVTAWRAAARFFRERPRAWLALALLASVVPVAGVFTTSNIFYVRDLTLAFRARYLWLRHTVAAGEFPLWDAYAAGGQPAVNDALYQIFHPLTLPIRLLLPELIGFNVWVALPIPLAALGAWLFFRRRGATPPAAALGAIAFAASGPIVSTGNFPNLSWSIAAVPYVFWAVDRTLTRRRAADVTLLAAMFALQALAGEPVTLAATGALVVAYAAIAAPMDGPRLPGLALVTAGLAAGGLLAAVQLAPTALAGRGSVRGFRPEVDDFWSFHPLALIELLVPHFYGNHLNNPLREMAWLYALNSKREPFYYSTYVGVPIAMLGAAAVAAVSRRREAWFWAGVIVVAVLSAFGSYTPFYPALNAIVPFLKPFRFPVKYLALVSWALAVLVAMTWDALRADALDRRRMRGVIIAAGALAAVIYIALATMLVAPRLPASLVYHLGQRLDVPYPLQGAEFLLFRARPLLTGLLLKLLAAGVLLWIAASARCERHAARIVLGLACAADLVIGNASVNPTIPERLMRRPAWIEAVRQHPEVRTYIGGVVEGWINVFDVDAPKWTNPNPAESLYDTRAIGINQLLMNPSGWQVREALTYDLPLLWPLDYARMTQRFKVASREERLRFLSRVGVRYCILPTPPYPGATPLAAVYTVEQMKLYDCFPSARRAYIVPDALIGSDVGWQLEGLFQPRFNPSAGVLVSEPPPPPAGGSGSPRPAAAAVVDDGQNRVVVAADLPADGYLALLDSYDPYWQVDVDGAPAPLMRANGLYRAVHLNPGHHIVTFTYRPSPVYASAALSGAAALGLTLWCAIDRRRVRSAARAAAPGAQAVS
jgi:hypothetical protein